MHPARPHPFPTPLIRLLPLLLCLTGCSAIGELALPDYFVLTLPATVIVIALTSLAYGLLCGFALGTSLATKNLRAADSAAACYHRMVIAEILDRSSVIHELVHDILAQADLQIAQLRWELEDLKAVYA